MDDQPFAGPEQFQRAAVRRYREADVPGFGPIRMQSLSELEIAEWETEDLGDDGTRNKHGQQLMRAGLIVRMLVDGEGLRRFHNSHREMVAASDYAIVGAVFELCREHAGIPRRDIDALEALRQIQKNLEPGRG